MASDDSSQVGIDPEKTDWFLETIVRVYAGNGITLGVTLTVGGACITGTLISGKRYFTELSAMLRAVSKSDGDIAEVISDTVKTYTGLYDKPEDAPDDWDERPVGYIHLMGARYVSPSGEQMPSAPGMLWRGKLSAVDAFSVGEITRQ